MQVLGAGARRVWLQVGGGWVLLRQLHDSDEDVAWRNVLRRMHRHHEGPQAVDARTDAAEPCPGLEEEHAPAAGRPAHVHVHAADDLRPYSCADIARTRQCRQGRRYFLLLNHANAIPQPTS